MLKEVLCCLDCGYRIKTKMSNAKAVDQTYHNLSFHCSPCDMLNSLDQSSVLTNRMTFSLVDGATMNKKKGKTVEVLKEHLPMHRGS